MEPRMNSLPRIATKQWFRAAVLLAGLVLLGAGPYAAEPGKQKAYATPEEAAQELAAAAKADDVPALLSVLGSSAASVVVSGDPVADRATFERFATAYEEAKRIDKQGDARATLSVGKDEWPLPFPLVKTDAGWQFDAKQGRDEVLTRRIGSNELQVIQVMEAYVDAQQEYYVRDPDNSKVLRYAQKIRSSKGKRDGLYFPTGESEAPSPLGDWFARAQAEGYKPDDGAKPIPYHGYLYRILKAQGPDAKGGAYDYVVRGNMMGGFALVAYPAIYGNSGVMTFIVNQSGIVYQKDLGPSTASIAGGMTRFNPDQSWKAQ
jgi:hypothetical protein